MRERSVPTTEPTTAPSRPDQQRCARRRGWLLGHARDSQVCLRLAADQTGSKHIVDACNRGKAGPSTAG